MDPQDSRGIRNRDPTRREIVQPVLFGEVTALGTVRLLEAIRQEAPKARVYNAATSEMFGNADYEPQDENLVSAVPHWREVTDTASAESC